MGWSSAVGPDGHVTALEFSPEYAAIAKEAFAKNGIKNVDIVVGDATESWVAAPHISTRSPFVVLHPGAASASTDQSKTFFPQNVIQS